MLIKLWFNKAEELSEYHQFLLGSQDIPEVKYYDAELEKLCEIVDQVRSEIPEVKSYDSDIEAICGEIDLVKENIQDLPEVKYYDEQVTLIEDRIDTLQTEITNLPEVKYYDKEIEAICEAIDAVKEQIPKFPKWVNEVNEVPDFSWIGKTFSVIDDDFTKVNDTIDGLQTKVDFNLNELSEDIDKKYFSSSSMGQVTILFCSVFKNSSKSLYSKSIVLTVVAAFIEVFSWGCSNSRAAVNTLIGLPSK